MTGVIITASSFIWGYYPSAMIERVRAWRCGCGSAPAEEGRGNAAVGGKMISPTARARGEGNLMRAIARFGQEKQFEKDRENSGITLNDPTTF